MLETAVAVTSPDGTISEGVAEIPQVWTTTTVLSCVHRNLRRLLPETDGWSWRLVKDEQDAVASRSDTEGLAPASSYRFVLHAAGHSLLSNPIGMSDDVAESPAFMRDPHFGPSQHPRTTQG